MVARARSAKDSAPIIQTATVERGSVVSTVSASGLLQPLTTIDLKSNAGGRVDTLAVDVGSTVRAGQLIAKIDPTDSLTALNQAQADLTAANAKVSQSRDGMILESEQNVQQVRQAQDAYESARVRLAQAEMQSNVQPALTKSAIQQAEANYRVAQQNLRQLKIAGVPQGTMQIKSAYNQAKAAIEKAKRNNDRQQNLYNKGFVSAGAFDQAKLDYETAKAEMDSAQSRMSTVDQDYDAQVRSAQAKVDQTRAALENSKSNGIQDNLRKQDVIAARAAVRQAASALAAARSNSRQVSIKAADIQSSRSQVVRDKATVDNARIQLNYTTVTAPRAGVVLKKYVEAGTIVTSGKSSSAGTGAGTSIVELGDLSRMFVLASVDETDIAQVRIGQRVNINIDAYPDQVFQGKVTKIDPQTVVDQNVTTIPVTVEIFNPDVRMKPGMNATCNFIAERKDNVLVVPSEAIKDQDGHYSVTVLSQGKQIHRRVKIGIAGDETTEIVRGLKEGDKVVTAVIDRSPRKKQGASGGMGGPMGGMGGGGRGGMH